MSIEVTSDGKVWVYFRFNFTLFESPTPYEDKLTSTYNELTETTYYRWETTDRKITFGSFESRFNIWGHIEDPNEIGIEEPFANPFYFTTDPAENGFDFYRKHITYFSLTPPSADEWWWETADEFRYYDNLRSDDYAPFIERKFASQAVPTSVLHLIPSQYKFISLAENLALSEALAEQRKDLAEVLGEDVLDPDDVVIDNPLGDDPRALLFAGAEKAADFLGRTADAIKVLADLGAEAGRTIHDALAPVLADTWVDRATDALGDAAGDATRALMHEMARELGSSDALRRDLIAAMDNQREIYVRQEGAIRKVILLDNGSERSAIAWTAEEAQQIRQEFLDAGLSEEQKIIRDALKTLETEVTEKVKTASIGVKGAAADKFGGLSGGALDDIAAGFGEVVRPGTAFASVAQGIMDYGFSLPAALGAPLLLDGDVAYALGDPHGDSITSQAARSRVALADGDDRFSGGKGQDEVSGDGGADVLLGGGGSDWLFGGGGGDTLRGGAGFDALLGAGGRDKLIGGGGGDLVIGGGGNDRLKGGGGDDELHGEAGRDKLIGQGGNDLLFGGRGKDMLKGGSGADIFVFETARDAGRGKGADKIADFASGVDKIDLSALALAFIGETGFTGIAGELRWDAGANRLFADLDGDAGADLALVLRGDFAGDAGDLIL
jgi:Ca2+-binding RTX toxin-like protein